MVIFCQVDPGHGEGGEFPQQMPWMVIVLLTNVGVAAVMPIGYIRQYGRNIDTKCP